jgi:hypothetical protein
VARAQETGREAEEHRREAELHAAEADRHAHPASCVPARKSPAAQIPSVRLVQPRRETTMTERDRDPQAS